jgi:hypothetical protein
MMAVEEFLLEPGGVLARELDRGQRLQITDVQGQQVGDLVAFNRADLNEKFWISNTVRLNATVYLTTGNVLYSELSNPMLSIISDSCGRHDLLAGSCNAEIDKVRYGVDDHLRRELRLRAAAMGHRARRRPDVVQPVHELSGFARRVVEHRRAGIQARRPHRIRCRDGSRREPVKLPSGQERVQRWRVEAVGNCDLQPCRQRLLS